MSSALIDKQSISQQRKVDFYFHTYQTGVVPTLAPDKQE
jgi:hypothetical protein